MTISRETSVYASMTWRSYAKINLYLDVLKRRRDGYHNIETIFFTVGLADDLTFMEDIHLSMTCTGANLDTGASNLVFRAATLLKKATGYPHGARIHLEKRIPIAAGLAGGSGNAAATLLALNKLWNLRLTLPQLMRHARALGSDVPYCLRGGAMAACLRGERMRSLPAPAKGLWFALVHPPVAVSAGHVYGHPMLEKSKEQSFAGFTPSFRRAICAYAKGNWAEVVFNRMETPVFHEYPRLAEIKASLLESGCSAAAMSGSGSTLFGLCESKSQALRVADALKNLFNDCPVSAAPAMPLGVERLA